MNERGMGRAWNLPMDKHILEDMCKVYSKKEGRARYYDYAIEIADRGYLLQASIIILAVWNKARLCKIRSEEYGNILKGLEEVIKKERLKFEGLKGNFRTFDFKGTESSSMIKETYRDLSKIKGIENTGASKVMHLLNRDLFLMWDTKMRNEYGYPKPNEQDYLDYLTKMQIKVKDIEWANPNKTLPKAIDEFNYVKITLGL
jgi:hypothetical protein